MSFSVLDQIESSLAVKRVGIQEFAESPDYCNPPEAPIWMADLSFKPIGEIQVGDEVVGWKRNETGFRPLQSSTVLAVGRRQAPIVKVTMSSGRVFRCTPDHKWLTASFGGRDNNENDGEWYCSPREGRNLVHVVDPPVELSSENQLRAAWLGGIYDGEGHCSKGRQIGIAQSPTHNPEVHKAIGEALDALGLGWVVSDRSYFLKSDKDAILRYNGVNAATRQMVVNFVNWCKPVRRAGLIRKAMKIGWRTKDRIISIEEDSFGEVVSLTTSTGNYVANGYASKNCDKPLYPRQLVLLKLIFLEEMEGWEEDVLTYWINGGRGGNEIEISPDIRERREWLRENNYKHFREPVLVGGRRSSKGFITGIAMAKVMFDTLQLQDPGRYYGIDPTKNIMFSCIAGSEEQAKEYQFADFSSTVDSCKAFDRHIVKSLETEIRVATETDLRLAMQAKARGNKTLKDIARIRGKALASNAGTLRGSATMAACIDEMAHMLEGISKASASTVYEALEPSLAQFREDGILFSNSSPYTEVGKFHEKYKEGLVPMSEEGNPRVLTIRFPSWALYEGFQNYRTEWNGKGFDSVPTACPDWDINDKNPDGTDLWPEKVKQAVLLEQASERANSETYRVEKRARFAVVTDAYLNPGMVERMYAGVPIGYDDEQRPIYEPISTNWGESVRNIYRYKGHLDPSSTTAGFGFAMGHIEMFTNPQGEEEPHVVFDIIKRWKPQDFKGGAIHWDTVMKEVMMYVELFRPYELTLDQYNSAEPIQKLNRELRERNLEGIRIYEKTATPPVNWKRADVYKTALYQGLVHAPNDTTDTAYSALELKFLQEHRQNSKYSRIDHPTVGEVKTKDMADCIMEVTSALIGNLIASRIQQGITNHMLVPGAEGGYRIGGDGLSNRSRATPDAMKEVLSQRKGEQSVKGQRNVRRGRMSVGRRRSRGW